MKKPCRSHHTPIPLQEFLYGSPYYPEHWDEEIRAGDPELFRAAGWNVVRMAEFAWDLMEPEEGRFDFTLFDEMIAQFGSAGIRTILCTPTATAPRWLTYRYPEVLGVDAKGMTMSHGSRQHTSYVSPVYREHSRRITRAMAQHYASNPHVIGWQTDNEIHCGFFQDHSPAALAQFIDFLQVKFEGDIQRLNKAWGTAVWAQTYRSFDEIVTPRPGSPGPLNPAHVLDYYRFLAHGAAVFQRDQVQILRASNPGWWITHNGLYSHLDYAGEFGADLDFLSFDSYSFFFDGLDRAAGQSCQTDMTRAFCGNFITMEQQSGPGGQGDYFHDNPEPGEVRKMAYVGIARGSDGMLFFRERTCRFGAEEYWCGVLDHDNVPRRRYREVAQLGEELKRVGPAVMGTAVSFNLGIASSEFDTQHGHYGLPLHLPDPVSTVRVIHRHFYDRGYAVGCVHPADSLIGIQAYFIPHYTIIDPQWVPAWTDWVQEGGILVIGGRSGTKDLDNNVIAETAPGVLRHLVGGTVEEYGAQNRPEQRPLLLATKDGEPILTKHWYELLLPDTGTEAVATWQTRHLKGGAAMTLKRHGAGAVLYVGTYFTPELLATLEPLLSGLDGFPQPVHAMRGVEVSFRSNDARRLQFIINHNEHAVEFPLTAGGRNLITDQPAGSSLYLEPNGVAVIET